MTLTFKYRCETCGEIFDDAVNAKTHLETGGNEDHIIDEEYINSGGTGVPVKMVMKSPDGTVWAISVDDDGVLQTEEVT
jgi:hypothetical protein